MNIDYVEFQRFNHLEQEQATEMIELLKQNGVDFRLEDYFPVFDLSQVNNELSKGSLIKIKRSDFEKASGLFSHSSKDFNQEHFLNELSDEELLDVIKKPEEWGYSNYFIAQNILKARGKEIDLEELEIIKKRRIQELSKTEEPKKSTLFLGYFSAFFGGLFGFIIGWHLSTFKKTLPNGGKLYAYSSDGRKHGARIFYLAIASVLVWIMLLIVML